MHKKDNAHHQLQSGQKEAQSSPNRGITECDPMYLLYFLIFYKHFVCFGILCMFCVFVYFYILFRTTTVSTTAMGLELEY